MRAILIDDEKPALLQMERLLQNDGRIQVAGKYTSARAGLDHLAGDKVDIVFLDIGMPEMNGLEVARHIQDMQSHTRIVYVTAYSEYAVQAFELHALDYLLKPIHPARFAKTLDRIGRDLASAEIPRADRQEAEPPQPVKQRVLCFQRLEWQDGGGTPKPVRWRTAKAQELFAYLVYHKGQWISKDHILDTLWPDYSLDKATTALHTSVSQIRRMLKEFRTDSVLEYALERYRLTGDGLETDVEAFEVFEAEEAAAAPDRMGEKTDGILALYRGNFLEDHDYAWALPIRKKLMLLYEERVIRKVEYDLEHGRKVFALRQLNRLQELEPYSDKVCRLNLTAYARNEDYTGLERHYRAFVKLLFEELGVEPEVRTANWYERLIGGKK